MGHVTWRLTNNEAPWGTLPVVFPVCVCKLKNWKCDNKPNH